MESRRVGGVPTFPLTVSVRGGFYKVVLGDTSITGMSTLPDQLLAANDDLELAIWFSDGVNGIARLGSLIKSACSCRRSPRKYTTVNAPRSDWIFGERK